MQLLINAMCTDPRNTFNFCNTGVCIGIRVCVVLIDNVPSRAVSLATQVKQKRPLKD